MNGDSQRREVIGLFNLSPRIATRSGQPELANASVVRAALALAPLRESSGARGLNGGDRPGAGGLLPGPFAVDRSHRVTGMDALHR